MLENFRKRMAAALLKGTQKRSYAGAGGGRLTASWRSPTSSADAELSASIDKLRNRSRELVRNSSYAKRAKTIVVNNVIGSGIGMQGQVRPLYRGRLDDAVNGAIEEAWAEWCRAEQCHTAGRMHFADLERLVMGEVFEAGEVLIRKHYRSVGGSKIPLALEVIEAERLAGDFTYPPTVDPKFYRMGIEHDADWRPVAYWIRDRHPGDIRPFGSQPNDVLVRVPARDIIHLMISDRSPQTRGVPWLHTAMRRLNDMDGYTEAEIVAARAGAMYLGFITKPDENIDLPGADDTAGQTQIDLEPGLMQRLAPGEEVSFNNPQRPNAALDPFLRYLLREVSAGVGVSYESLSRDYSQSNYSSSRLALLDDRDLWKTLQAWFIRSFREPLHREWLQAAVLSRAVTAISVDEYAARPAKFEAVKFKPRGWSWVDPTKEVDAYKEAIKAGLTTRTDVIAMTASGLDIEDVDATRAEELAAAADLDLEFDTDPEAYMPPEPAEPVQASAQESPPPDDEEEPEDEPTEDPPTRVFSFGGRK